MLSFRKIEIVMFFGFFFTPAVLRFLPNGVLVLTGSMFLALPLYHGNVWGTERKLVFAGTAPGPSRISLHATAAGRTQYAGYLLQYLIFILLFIVTKRNDLVFFRVAFGLCDYRNTHRKHTRQIVIDTPRHPARP